MSKLFWTSLFFGALISGLYSGSEYFWGLIFSSRDWNFVGINVVTTYLLVSKLFSMAKKEKKN